MNRLALLLVAASLLFSLSTDAQSARNVAYFELGGSAVIPSFNYERRITDRWHGRIGASWVVGESAGDDDQDTTFVIPLTVSTVSHAASNHHLELGGGLTIATGDRQELFADVSDDQDETFSAVFATGIVGYRYQRPAGGFQFRAVFTPVVGGGEVLPWAGLSFGYAW